MDWGTFINWLFDALFGRYESVLRLVLAGALGGIIGLEREASGKPAGFRTNVLICMGAALIMELSVSMTASKGDPGRIGAQIVSGIGFLGAGTILHFRGNVIGLTTAATLWVVAAIGMAVGASAYIQAIGATLLVMLTLMLLGRVEDHLIPGRRPPERMIDVVMQSDVSMIYEIEQLIARAGFTVETMKAEKTGDVLAVSYQARGKPQDWDPLLKQLLSHEVVRKVELI